MPKMKNLTLSFPHFDPNLHGIEERTKPHNQLYRVEKATDTTEYPPTTMLNKRQVDELCSAPGWNITIITNRS